MENENYPLTVFSTPPKQQRGRPSKANGFCTTGQRIRRKAELSVQQKALRQRTSIILAKKATPYGNKRRTTNQGNTRRSPPPQTKANSIPLNKAVSSQVLTISVCLTAFLIFPLKLIVNAEIEKPTKLLLVL